MKIAKIQLVRDQVVHEDTIYLATKPRHAHFGDAGADVEAFLPHGPLTIAPDEVALIPTGLRMRIPEGTGLLILPRSSMGKRKLKVANSPGLLDHTYTGELMVAWHNESTEAVTIEHGERIGQLVLVDVYCQDYEDVESLEETERGEGGFGSTGRFTLEGGSDGKD